MSPRNLQIRVLVGSVVRLPAPIEAYRAQLHRVQTAVDRERLNPDPAQLYKYPVKLPLYKHQIRAANMALLTFGLIAPQEVSV